MARIGIGLVVFLLAGATAHAELRITEVRAAYNPVWPGSTKLEYYPTDVVFLRFVVAGARRNSRGEVDFRTAVRLTDMEGKEAASQAMPRRTQWLALGGDSFVSFAGLLLEGQVPPGEYRATVTVTDEVSAEEATRERPLTVKPMELAVVAPSFSYDPERRIPAPPGGDPTRTLYWRLNLIGFACPGGEVDLKVAIEYLDAAGQERLSDPEDIPIRRGAREGASLPRMVYLDGSLALSRPGLYLMRVTVTDRMAHKTAKFERSLHITLPRDGRD
jgi:hypothetical protein